MCNFIHAGEFQCLYFHPHFLKAFKKILALKVQRWLRAQKMFYTANSTWKMIFENLFFPDSLSDAFFLKVKKLLIQHFPLRSDFKGWRWPGNCSYKIFQDQMSIEVFFTMFLLERLCCPHLYKSVGGSIYHQSIFYE